MDQDYIVGAPPSPRDDCPIRRAATDAKGEPGDTRTKDGALACCGKGDCLGRGSDIYLPALEGFIVRELSLRQYFLALARRGRRFSDPLRALASVSFLGARRLSAAGFLIGGRRCWPCVQPPLIYRTVQVELRDLFDTVTGLEYDYRDAAGLTRDPCLAALYRILAEEKIEQMGRILRVVAR